MAGDRREKKPVEGWKKPHIGPETASRLREILRLGPTDDLPEQVYLTLGLHLAMNIYLHLEELPYGELCRIVIEAANFPIGKDRSWVKPGWTVNLKSDADKPAIYVCRGPFGLDLVNKYGQWLLVDPDLIDVSEEGKVGSTLNENASLGQALKDAKVPITRSAPAPAKT